MSVSDGWEMSQLSCDLQVYSGLSRPAVPCCSVTVHRDTTVAELIRVAGPLLGAEPVLGAELCKLYMLVEVREADGGEFVMGAGDVLAERVLQWPRTAWQPHPQSLGYYFVLRERVGHNEGAWLRGRGFLPPESEEDVDDLCSLPVVCESSILCVLRTRFLRQKIYTYAGTMLLALNPFTFLPIYNPKHMDSTPSPHVFAVAEAAYRAMLHRQVSQCILISGESGSGKTQSTNFIIHCLSALSQKGYASGVERIILGAGPVLEAFGNAKTAHNNNSSRFGKFIQVNYQERGVVRGAVFEKYLLEKSRLVSRQANERNYHVFYYLLAGASEDERVEFSLMQSHDYIYLTQENVEVQEQADLQHEFERLQQAMDMVGFLPATRKQIFSILSAILYLGNVTYSPVTNGRDEGLQVGTPQVLAILSHLLQVREDLLVEALTKRRTVTANDTLILPYSLCEAVTARDSMAKSLYSALFDWILLRINHALLNKRDLDNPAPCLSIGVLDIFGFEDFTTNSFEQFCINYANEQLQYYFTQYIFKLEQEEYQQEGISWHNITYTDNVGCIQLFSKKPTGLFYLLDEESSLPQATDKTLLAKFKQQHQSSSCFLPTAVMELAFVVRHFAGKVKYQVKDFREKNTDHMRADIVSLLRSSASVYVRQLVGMDPAAAFRWGVLRAALHSVSVFKQRSAATHGQEQRRSHTPLAETHTPRTPRGKLWSHSSLLEFSFDHSVDHPLDAFEDIFANYEMKKKMRGSKQKQIIPKNLLDSRSLKYIVSHTLHDRSSRILQNLHRKKKPPSISAQFQASLSRLMETLGRSEPFFIRCMRSNADKREMFFDESLVLQQLRYTGMLETVRMCQSGYSAKYTFQEFVQHFWVLLPKHITCPKSDITDLLQRMGLNQNRYQIGKSKVFLKEPERQQLLDARHRLVVCKLIFLQRWFRARLERKHFLQMREAAVIIQRVWRRTLERGRYMAAARIQAVWRGSQQRADYLRQRASIKKMQALVRGNSARRRYQEAARKRREQKHGDPHRANIEQTREKEKGVARAGVSVRSRPTSLPLDSVTSRVKSIRDKDRSQQSGLMGSRTEKASLTRRMSVSLDDITAITEVVSDGHTTVRAGNKDRKRRLANARSGLFLPNEDVEFWSFPLPPISPSPSTGHANVPVPPHISEVDTHKQAEPLTDASLNSPGKRVTKEDQKLTIPQPPTPERTGFLRKILKKRSREPHTPDNVELSPLTDRAALADRHGIPVRHNPSIRISRSTRVTEHWNASLDRQISSVNELKHLDDFLGNQVNDLRSRGKQLSQVETIFMTATMDFRETIKGLYSISNSSIHYKKLMVNYQNVVTSLAGQKHKAEVQLVVNLFQSVLDGFLRAELKRQDSDTEKNSKKQKKRRDKEKVETCRGHMFTTYQVTIMQSCDQCNSKIWGMEKAYMCSSCKMVCHKKCIPRITKNCSRYCVKKAGVTPTNHFAVDICLLASQSMCVPVVMTTMLEHVELSGLYTEGIYRKSGSAQRVRELRQHLDADPRCVCLEDYPIHTVTGLVKQWLRELPDPLLTYTHYSDFLRAVELPDKSEQLHAIYNLVDRLPPAYFNTLERLVLHLVMVAKEEAHNRMSCTSLAVVFAPCILRSPDTTDPLSSMQDVNKTTACVEMLLNEQMRQYKEKLKDLQQLEVAEALAIKQLKLRRQNTICQKPSSELHVPDSVEKTLLERLRSIKQEKDELAWRLPDLDPSCLDCDSSPSDMSISYDSLAYEPTGRESPGTMTPEPLKTRTKKQLDPTVASESHTDTTHTRHTAGQRDCSTAPAKPRTHEPFSALNIPYIDDTV